MERITCADLMEYLEKEPEKVMVLDIETTGFYAPQDEVLSLAIIDGTGETLYYDSFKPEHNTAWPEAQAVNGISPDDVADGSIFTEETEYINLLLAKAEVIVGYNQEGFDLPFLAQFAVCPPEEVKLVDVMLDYAEIHGEWDTEHQDWKWQKLTACAAHYGYQYRAHDSLEDAEATLFCARCCGRDQLKEKKRDLEETEQIRVLIVRPGEAAEIAVIDRSLTSMQAIVGGDIDIAYPWQERVALVCNDEGLLEGLPLNRYVPEMGQPIAGTFFVCGFSDDRLTGLTDEQLARFGRMFHNPQQFLFNENKELYAVMDCVPTEPMEEP